MIDVGRKRASLRRRSKQPPRRDGFLGLQSLPQIELTFAIAVQLGAGGHVPSLLVAMLTMPMSTPTNPLTGRSAAPPAPRRWRRDTTCRPGAPGRTLQSNGSATAPTRVPRRARARSSSTMGGPDRHRRFAATDLLRDLPGQAPRIKRLGRMARKPIGVAATFLRFWEPGGP